MVKFELTRFKIGMPINGEIAFVTDQIYEILNCTCTLYIFCYMNIQRKVKTVYTYQTFVVNN